MAKTQIKNYVFNPGIGALDNLYPNAYSLLESNKLFIQKEATAWIQSQVDAGESGFVGYTYNQETLERDIENTVDAYLYDLRYGGNSKTYKHSSYYWDQDVAQISGDRQPEIQTHVFIRDLITDYIFTNTLYSAENLSETQVITDTDAETAAEARIDTLSGIVIGVITDGLSSLPTLEPTGVGTIKIQGNYDTGQLLLITNTAVNDVIYNFSDPSKGGTIELTTDSISLEEEFASFLQATDAVSTITLNYDTSNQSSLDELQIFVEKTENGKSVTTTRPYDFGTDAIERMRVAQPLSMLDADFEYGLQPTKWAAIGTLRGYPSVYEVPGTDTPVLSVTTDASFGSTTKTFVFEESAGGTISFDSGEDRNGLVSGIVTDLTFIEGDRIRFISNNTTSATFLYLKTALAGTIAQNLVENAEGQGAGNGNTLSWDTEVGDAGTYFLTDASNSPSVTITIEPAEESQGVGQSLITVTTLTAHGITAGQPITIKALEDSINGASRAEGSFVVVDTPEPNQLRYFAKSKVGNTFGTVLSTTYTQLRQAAFYTGASIGDASLSVLSNGTSGTMITELGVLSGSTIIPYDGPSPEIGAPLTNVSIPVGAQVTGVNDTSAGGGTYITPKIIGDYPAGATSITVEDSTGIVENLAVNRGDGNAIYVLNVAGDTINFSDSLTTEIKGAEATYTVTGSNLSTNGVDATFDVSYTSGVYTVTGNNPGSGYSTGDRLLITGNVLGGFSPDNDLTIVVDSTFSDGAILTFSFEGTAFSGTGTVDGISPAVNGGQGSGGTFDIVYQDNVYTSVDVSSPDESTNYVVGDRIRITGDRAVPNGASPTNDAIITVTATGSGGSITSATIAGTAPDAQNFYDPDFTTVSGSGSIDGFDVIATGSSYSVTPQPGSTGWVPGDEFSILGTDVEGASPANDITIVVDTVDGFGEILTVITTGTAPNIGSIIGEGGTNIVGGGAVFDIDISSGSYSLGNIASGGSNYGPNQTFLVAGTELLGDSPANDLIITIDSVDVAGEILTVTLDPTATSITDTGSKTDTSAEAEQPQGAGASFTVTRDENQEYIVSISQEGSNYAAGNRILINGESLGGSSPLNDIIIRILEVDEQGSIPDDSSGRFTVEYEQAVLGTNLDFISTVIMSEATTSDLNRNATIDYSALAEIQVSFSSAHGLVPGDTFIVTVDSDDEVNNHALAAGSFFVSDIPTLSSLRYQARAPGNIDEDSGNDQIRGTVYPRPDSFFIHRPYDGGVQLGTGGPQHGAQAIRQSKKYIRYQSGKGIMYTTGALFAPSYDLRSVTAEDVEVGSEITVVCDDNDHGVQVGGIVRLLGIETPGYNSGPLTAVPPEFDYTVTEVIDERTFKVLSQRRLGATEAVLGFGAQMSVVAWHGATVRSGIFDDQNGIFWEFDGTQISVVQRTGTQQLAGTIAMTVDNNLVTGVNTRFRDQLKAGDKIIIKGMTHVVSHVNSQTECTVTPDWRGVVNITGAKANLIVDKKVKQSDFNLDRLDGTGPSGYDIDIAKMQMIGIQYSWYGAGFIDFMLRGADGNFVYAHRMRNSNVNTEAFMRSGNLPVRYEVTNEGPPGKLAEAMDDTQTYMVLEDTSFFPTSGTVYIDNEIIKFNGKNDDNNQLTNLIRGTSFTSFQAGATRQYTAGLATSHDDRTGVVLISQTITPLISHWGSAFITDGLFDEDRGYIFSYAETGVAVSTTKQTAFLIRLAPSVSNAIVGDLGERELLNRAQLLLQGLEITSETGTGGIVIEGILNPQNYPLNPDNIGWSELSGLAQGGQPSFAQIASGGSVVWNSGDVPRAENITVQGNINTSATVGLQRSNTNFIDMDVDSWNQSGGSAGDFVTASTDSANFGGGIEITRVETVVFQSGPFFNPTFTTYIRLTLASRYSGTASGQITIQRRTTTNNRNFGFFTKASVDSAGVVIGTNVTGSSTATFSANTLINNIQALEFGGTEFYRIEFNSSYSGELTAGTSTVELTFAEPPFAQPGETVFSFIANPGERSTLNLSELKELTNTPLGGRGTFPNGPDVLAINVYKASGADVDSNIIIRWGEAQA